MEQLELKALCRSIFGEETITFEEFVKQDLHPIEIEGFNFRSPRSMTAESIAKLMVTHFHEMHFSAHYKMYSLLVSHVILTQTNFRIRIILLSEENFVSVIALKA